MKELKVTRKINPLQFGIYMPLHFAILICPGHNILCNFNSNFQGGKKKNIMEWKSSLDSGHALYIFVASSLLLFSHLTGNVTRRTKKEICVFGLLLRKMHSFELWGQNPEPRTKVKSQRAWSKCCAVGPYAPPRAFIPGLGPRAFLRGRYVQWSWWHWPSAYSILGVVNPIGDSPK